MTLGQRILGAVGLVIIGGFAFVFLGVQVGRCLGPLGRTLIESIADGCLEPGVGIAMPVGALFLAAAAVMLLPVPRERFRGAALGAIIGGPAAGLLMAVASRLILPTTMTGPTSYGEVITVALPIDWNLLAAAAIVGTAVGAVFGPRRRLEAKPALLRR